MARRNKVVSAAAGRSDIPVIESVLIDKRVLAGYRKRAKSTYPREYLEAIFGKLRNGVAEIHIFFPFPHIGTRLNCIFDDAEIELLRQEAEGMGLEYLGSIHSHCTNDTCSHPSDLDHNHGVSSNEAVMGIMWIRKHNGWMLSQVSFNVPRKPVKVKFSV